MKIACDICEKIANHDSPEVAYEWTKMNVNNKDFMICAKCSKEISNFIGDLRKKILEERGKDVWRNKE